MQELINTFGIDYKILIAQIINFSIIFLVLYKFLVKPLNQIIEERQKKIEEGLKKREEAEKMIKEIYRLREEILKDAEKEKINILNEAKLFKENKLKEIEEEMKKLREEMIEKLNEEKENLRKEFYEKLNKELYDLFLNISYKVFHRKELNKEFIENILKQNE